jgi:hypothetical protein
MLAPVPKRCTKLDQCAVLSSRIDESRAPGGFDKHACGSNNRLMTRPEAARRVKSYSSATGYVYQYYFYEVLKVRHGRSAGNEYVYMVSRDRKKVFPVKIFIDGDAIEKWSKAAGRPFSGTEEYAVAKMRLFQLLDEVEDVEAHRDVVVDDSNLSSLLEALDL